MRKILGPFVSATLPLILTVACAPPAAPAEPAAEGSGADQVEAVLVEVATLEPTSFRELIDLVGETEPIRSAAVISETPGRITWLGFEEGDQVTEGQALVRLDTANQQVAAEQIEIQIAQLQSDLDRQQRLQQRGLGTPVAIEQIETQIAVLETQLRQNAVNTRQTRTTSPIAGTVVERTAEPGEYAAPGMALGRIIDVSTIVVRVGLPEREIGVVDEGMPVTVRIEADGSEHTGTLHRVGLEANRLNRTFPLEIRLDNPDGRLRSGMRATVLLPRSSISEAIVIPRDAVIQTLEGSLVYVEDDGLAHGRVVTTGPGRAGYVVVEQGLAATDRLIVRGHRHLVEGERVRVADTHSCCREQLDRLDGDSPAEDGSGTR
jgi:membrane fusion protein (multidrug efflux system)